MKKLISNDINKLAIIKNQNNQVKRVQVAASRNKKRGVFFLMISLIELFDS